MSKPKNVIFLSTKWCAICPSMKPKIQKVCLSEGVEFIEVDADEYPQRVPEGVSSVPTFIVDGGLVLTGMTANPIALRRALRDE